MVALALKASLYDKYFCLTAGADCVLGPANITKDDHVPIEQCISTCKLRPGSGALRVNVLADGPTRVLQISDSRSQVKLLLSHSRLIGRMNLFRFASTCSVC